MSHARSAKDFPHLPLRAGIACWQIDIDRLAPPLHDGAWLDELAQRLIVIAAGHPDEQLYGATHVDLSGEFGSVSRSAWFALSGSKQLRGHVTEVMRKLLPGAQVKGDTIDSSQYWVPAIYIDQGYVWVPYDASAWSRVDPAGDAEAVESDLKTSNDSENDADIEEEFDSKSSSSGVQSPKNALRYRAAKGDGSVGSLQITIERLFKLPEGSVKLVNPEKTFSNRNQSIRRLRERWDKS